MTDISAELATAIGDNVRRVIRDADANAPRSLQKKIGPSEYGHPCQRRIAYRILGHPETNPGVDPWKRNVGTAVHAYLEQVFGSLDETLPDGRPRYVAESYVRRWPAPGGKCDLLDRQLRTTVDWKLTGPTALANYRRSGDVGDTYRRQQHTYGAAWLAQGEQVEHVAVVFLPRNGDLKDIHVWTEPLDPAVVDATTERLHSIIATVAALDVETHPERYSLITATANRLCHYCPWFQPLSKDLGRGCPGDTADLTPDRLLMGSTA